MKELNFINFVQVDPFGRAVGIRFFVICDIAVMDLAYYVFMSSIELM